MYSLWKCIVACAIADYFTKSDYYLKDDFYHKDDYYPKGGDYNRIGYGPFGDIGSVSWGLISSGDVWIRCAAAAVVAGQNKKANAAATASGFTAVAAADIDFHIITSNLRF